MANKDPSKNDVKFDDEINSDLDNYDSEIADFFEEDIDGADKDRSPVERTLRSIKRNVQQAGSDALEGAGEGIKTALKTTMPKVKETWDAAEEVSSEVDTIKQAVMDKAMPVWNQTKRMLRTMGNKFGSQMPFGIDKAILKIAGEEEEAAPRELSKEETRNQNIQNTMGEIFKLQEKKSMEQQKDAILNRTLDRRIGQIHHKEDVSLLGTIAQQATFNTSFTKSIFTAYLKKDLELKYRSFYVATDTLEVMKVGLESLEKRLDAISKNTALPDADKLYMSERITGNLKSKLASGFNDKVQNIISKTANNLKEKILGGLDAADMGIGMFSQLIDAMQGPDDGMGFGDDSLTPMGMLKSFLFQSIGTALGKNLTNMAVGKLPKGFANQLNTMLRGGGKQGITQLLLEVQKGRYKLPEKLEWIKKLIPDADDILGKPQLYNDTYDNLDKGGKLTNKTIATIEEIIPGYLRMQTKFLEAIATKTVGKDKLKNTQEQYYDFKTMRFKAANVLKQEYKKEITERLTSSNAYEVRDLHERTKESVDYIFDNLGGPDSEANKNAFERVLNDEKYTKSIYQFLYNIAYSSEYGILTESNVEIDLAGLYDWLCTKENKYDQKDKKMPESVKRFGSIALNGIDKPDQQKQAIWYWYLLLTVVDPEESDDKHVARKANSNAITSINTLLTTIKGQGAEEALVNTMDAIKKSGHLSLIADDYTTVNGSGNLDIKSDVLAKLRTTGADGANLFTQDELNQGLSEEERKQWKSGAWKTKEEMAELTSKQGKSIIESFWDSIKSGGSAILEKTGLKEGFGEIKDALAGAAGDIASSAKDSALDVASTLHRGLAILRDIVSHDKDGNPLETGKYRDLKDLTDKEWNAWATQIGSLMDFAQILNKHKGNPFLELVRSAMPKQLRRIFDTMGDGDILHSQDNETREKIKELNEQYKEDLANISEDKDSDAYYQAVAKLNENYAQQVTELISTKEQSLKELQDRDINKMLKSANLDSKEKHAKKEEEAREREKNNEQKKFAKGANFDYYRLFDDTYDDLTTLHDDRDSWGFKRNRDAIGKADDRIRMALSGMDSTDISKFQRIVDSEFKGGSREHSRIYESLKGALVGSAVCKQLDRLVTWAPILDVTEYFREYHDIPDTVKIVDLEMSNTEIGYSAEHPEATEVPLTVIRKAGITSNYSYTGGRRTKFRPISLADQPESDAALLDDPNFIGSNQRQWDLLKKLRKRFSHGLCAIVDATSPKSGFIIIDPDNELSNTIVGVGHELGHLLDEYGAVFGVGGSYAHREQGHYTEKRADIYGLRSYLSKIANRPDRDKLLKSIVDDWDTFSDGYYGGFKGRNRWDNRWRADLMRRYASMSKRKGDPLFAGFSDDDLEPQWQDNYAKGDNITFGTLPIDQIGGQVDQPTEILGGAGIAGEAGGETIIPHKYNERFKELIYKCVRDTVGEQEALAILKRFKPSKALLDKLHITDNDTDTTKFAKGGVVSKIKDFFFGKKDETEDEGKVVTKEKQYKREYGIDETNDILKNILLVNEAMYDRMKSGLMSIDALRYVDPKNLRNVIGNLRNSGFFGSLRNFVSATTDLVSAPVAGAWGLATGAVTNSLGMARHMLFNKTCDVYRAPPVKGAKPDPVKDLLIRKEAFETGVFKDEKLSKPIKSVADLTIPAYGYDKDGSPKTLIDVGDAPNGLCDVNGKPLVSSGGVIGRTIHNVVKGIFSTMGVNIHLKDIWKGIGDFKRGLIDPYCDVYSFRDPDTALVSGDDIKEGLIVTIDPKDGEKSVVKDVFDIKGVCHKLEIDPNNPSKRILSDKPVIKPEDINAGLCDINRHPIKSSLLTKFGLLFRKTGGKVFGAIGSVIEKSAKGMGAVVSTLWNAGTWVVSHAFDFTVKAFKSKNKFIDVYVVRNGKKECVIRGDDLKDNKDTKKYIYRDGEPVTSAYGIKKEVISWFSEDGNTQLKEARIVISTTDIDNGLFDEEGHKLTAFAGKSLVGKLASVGMGVLKFAGGKALKLGIGALKMTGKVISALGSILGEGGAVVTGWIGNIWNQTIDLFKSSLISRIDLEEIVGRRLADIYGLLYNWMPRRESDDKDGDGLLDNRYKEWKEGKRKAKEKKEESKKDKDDEKKPGFFARLFGSKDKEGGGGESGGGDGILDDILTTYFSSKIFGGGEKAAGKAAGKGGGGKVGLLRRMFGWLPFGKKAAAIEGAAGKAAGKAAGEAGEAAGKAAGKAAGEGGAIKKFFKKTWSKLGFGGRTAASAGSKGLIRAGAGLVLKTALKMATGLGFAWLAADAIGLTYKLTKDDTRVVAMRNVRFPAYGVNTKYWEAIEDLETDTFSELSDGNDTGVDEKRLRQFGYKIDFLNDAELSVGGNKLTYLKAWYTKRFIPAYKTYCKTLMSIRDAIAIQEYSSDPDADRNNPPEQDLSQPKADDIPDTMFGESCQQIEKALQPYSGNDTYILDGEHFEAWMAEMSERAEEAGIGDSLKYDEAALVDENTKIFGSATANFSYAWTELKHGNLLNSAAAATKGVLGTIGKLVKGYIEFQQSLINLGEWTDWSTEVSKYEQIWEEIRFKLYGFDVTNEDADTKKRFSEQFRVIEADQVHFIDKEQPEPTKEEFEAWTDEFFTDADLEKVRYKVLNEGIDESEIRGGFREEAKRFIISWWRRIFLPVFTAYATTVRVTAGAEPGDAIVVDDIPEDARSAALKEFEKNANDLLRSNKLDADILKLSIDGFANYLIERCQSDVAEYDKDSANLKTSMDESFGTLLSKGLNQSGQHFSRAWTALKDFRFKTAIKESIKGIKEGAVGIYNAVAEGMGSGISDFLHGSVTAGKFIERFYDYGFPDMSGHTDFFEPDHVKAARKFELRVAQSWRAGYKDEIEDEHFNSIMRSTHLLRDIIKEAGAVSKPTGGPAVKSMRSSPASNKAYERVENVLSYGEKYSHTRIISIMKTFLDEESIKLVSQAYEYLKFWLKIRMEKVFSAFASVVSGYGVDLDPFFGSIDTDDIPADKREEAYAAYQKKKEGLLDKSVKFYMLTSQGFFKYRDDLKKVAEDMKVGKAPSVAPMAKQLEEMRKQRKKQEDTALVNLSVKLSPVMRKTGSDLKKMITDTSDIDVAVEDAKTMSNEAADEVIRTLGMATFTNGRTMSQRDSLIAVFNTVVALGADGSESHILAGVKQLQESAYEFIFSADTKQSEQEDKLKSLVTDFTKIILEYGNKQGARDIAEKELEPVQYMYGHAALQKLGITIVNSSDIGWMTYNDVAKPNTMFYTYMACWFGKVFVPIYVYFVLAINRLLNQTIGAKPDLNALNKVQIAQLIKILRNVRNKINLGKFAKLYLNHGVRKEDLIRFFDQWLTDEKKESDARKNTRADREAARKSEAEKKKQQEAEQAAQQKQAEDARRSRAEEHKRFVDEEIRKADDAQRGTDSPESQQMADGVKRFDKTVNKVLNSQPTDPYAPVNNDTSSNSGGAGNTPVQDNIGKPEYNDPMKPNVPEAPTKDDTLKKSLAEQQKYRSNSPASGGGDNEVQKSRRSIEPDSHTLAAKLWKFFKTKGWTDESIAALLGNFHKESNGIHTIIVQNDLSKSRQKSIAYTERADNATADELNKVFVKDSKGYGLAQWTYHTRKRCLWNFAHSNGKSIGDPDIQIAFLYDELTGESKGKISIRILTKKGMTAKLKNSTDLKEATDIVLLYFEAPAAVTNYVKTGVDSDGRYRAELYERLGWAKHWYDKFHNKNLDDMPDGGGSELKSPFTPEMLMAEEAKKKAGGDDTSDRLKAAGRRLVKQAEKHERAEEQAEQNEERTNQGKKQKGNPKNVKKIVKGSKPARGSFASQYGGKDTGAAASTSASSGSPKFNYKGVTIPQSREEAIQILKSLPSMKGAKTSYGGKDWKSVGNLSAEFLKRLAVGGQLAEQSGKQKPWTITSAFRTYKEQAALKLKYPKDAARPGTSRHETGIAIDLGDGSFGGIKNKPYDRGTSVDQIEPFLKAVGITRRYRPGKLNEAQHFELAQGKLPDLQQFATDSGAAAAQDAAKEIKDTLPPTDNNAKEAATKSRKASSALDSKDTSAAEVSVSAAEAPRTAAVSSGASAGVNAGVSAGVGAGVSAGVGAGVNAGVSAGVGAGSDFITQELGNLQDQLGLSGTSTNPASTDTTGVLPSHIPSNRADIMDITDIGKRPDHIPHMAELPDHLYGTTEYFDEDYKGGKLPDYIPGHYANLDDMPGIGQLPSNIPNMAVLPDYVPGAIIQQEKAYVPGTLPSHIAGKLPNLDDIYDTGVLPGYIPKMSELPDHLYGTTEYYDENYTPGKLPGHIPGHYANLDDMPGIGELPKNIPGHYTNLDDLPGVGQLPSHIPNISTLPSNIPYLRAPRQLAQFARTRDEIIANKAKNRNTLGILPGHIPNMATLPDHIPGVMSDLKGSDGTQTATAPITPTLNLPNDQLKNNTAQFIDRALADLKNSNAAQPAPANTAASRYASNVNTSTFSRTNTGVSTASYTQADVDRTKDGSTPVVAELRLITEVVRNILAFMQSKYADREKEKQGANSLTTPTLTKEEASFWDKLTPEAFAKLIVSAMQSAAPANAPAAAPAPHTVTSMARAPMNYPLNTSKS
jgi:hypothetical protein